MSIEQVMGQLAEGVVLDGPHWTEPVKVLTAKLRATRVEVQAVGLHTKRLWTKLLKEDDFQAIKITQTGQPAVLDGNPKHFRLASEAHRIRLAYQYDPHFAVSVSQVDPLPHQLDAVYGHPLFEGVVERVVREFGPSLRQGAVFYNAEATEPTVLWLLKSGIEEGRGQPAGERLHAVHRTGDEFRKSQPYALLDQEDPERVPALPADLRQVAADEDAVINWSLDEVVAPYFREVSERRTRELGIKEKYVRKSLQFLISESTRKIGGYDAQLRQIKAEDDQARLPILGNRAKEVSRRDELSQRMKDRLEEIEQERHLSEKPPELLGVAVILPPPALAAGDTDHEQFRLSDEAIQTVEKAEKLWASPSGLTVSRDQWLELLASVHYLKHIAYFPKGNVKDFDAVFAALVAAKPQFKDRKPDVRKAWDRLDEFGLIAAKALA